MNTQIVPVRDYPTMLLKKRTERVLVISDLHLGWEAALAQEGVHVPSQASKLLEKLVHLVKTQRPTSLIVLGDVKHTIAKVEMEEWRDIPEFFEKVANLVPKVQIIPGNHDGNLEPLLPENVEVLPSKWIIFWDVGLSHGHIRPPPEMLTCKCLVIGHVHPVVVFRDPSGFRITRQVWVKATCDPVKLAHFILNRSGTRGAEDPVKTFKEKYSTDLSLSQLFILPSFNDFLGGQAINRSGIGRGEKFSEFIGPIMRSGSINIEEAEVYLLDGTFLGTVRQLRAFG